MISPTSLRVSPAIDVTPRRGPGKAPATLLPTGIEWSARRYAVCAAAVLALAAFNLFFRAGSEMISVWDESLYAISAWEMITSGDWIGTTFLGRLDSYNSKPPLNVWLIALSLKALGASLLSLRLPSLLAAWSTVAVLQEWSRRAFGPSIALLASLVLATSYGFLYVHSGRSANTDALLTLFVLLTVVTLWAARERPWRRVWLGPLMAGVFLLKGLACLLPLAIVGAMEIWTPRRARERWWPLAVAAGCFVIPVGAWAMARWRLDRWEFLLLLWRQDFVDLITSTLDNHAGGPLYYAHVLQKYHYDWLVAGLVSVLLCPIPWTQLREQFSLQRGDIKGLLLSWGAVTTLVPTAITTKLPWYLNSFYPLFALVMAWLLNRGISRVARDGWPPLRSATLGLVVVLALGVAEGKLAWHSYDRLDLRRSPQGLLLEEAEGLAGRRVFRRSWPFPEIFIARFLRAEYRTASSVDDFLGNGRPGDYLLLAEDPGDDRLELVRANTGERLYRRRD
ncbi:MAG: hypothetical protein EXQ59_04125 [Acidobacteria bacterium]|nr:hypothetical protein [Acidobacteriota bacterium]